MKLRTVPSGLRMEQALRLLPSVEALDSLRSLLYATAHENLQAGRYGTVAKWSVDLGALRESVKKAAAADAERAGQLFDAAVGAIEAFERGDRAAATRAFLAAGAAEERKGRLEQAGRWYRHAALWARDLRNRSPEIEAVLRVGRLDVERGRWPDAERALGRCLVLADAESDARAAAEGCLALGELERARFKWSHAESWYRLGLAKAPTESRLRGALAVGRSRCAVEEGRLDDAESILLEARGAPGEHEDAEGAVRTLLGLCALEEARARPRRAFEWLREAHSRIDAAGDLPALDVEARLSAGRIHAAGGRFHHAESEARRAERIAVRHDLGRELVRTYALLGRIRRKERDETGFVFFEIALELLRGPDPAPHLEAEVCVEYGRFRSVLGDWSEAEAYWARAREFWKDLGAAPRVRIVEGLLAGIPARDAAREQAERAASEPR